MLDLQKDSVKSVGFTESVMKYIEAVKQKTALEIGLTFAADDFLAYYDKPPMDCKFLLNNYILITFSHQIHFF